MTSTMMPTSTTPQDPELKATTEAQEYKTVVLAGNPNVGKSVVFGALTGQYVVVSNFPGTTVDITKGTMLANNLPIEDTPGVYGLSQLSEEEQVALERILAADVVINVVSALSLERDLFLTQQIIDYRKPLMVVINQWDEAEKQGLNINTQQLQTLLGVPVTTTVATANIGIEKITQLLPQACQGSAMLDCPDAQALQTLEQDPGERIKLYGHRRIRVNQIVAQVVQHPQEKPKNNIAFTLGQWLLNPVLGIASLIAVLGILYQVVGVWIAGDLVNWLEQTVFLSGINPVIQAAVGLVLPKSSTAFNLLAGEFGIISMTLQYLLGVITPLVFGFYFYVALLEDCGYLPRIAVLSDGLLNKIGLNGRAIIPIILGFGCVTMAAVATRVLTSQRERTIASTILAITIPCSAQIGVMVGLIAAAGGLKAFALYNVVLVAVLAILGSALNMILPGKSSALILDLPPLRLPRLGNVIKKTWIRGISFIWEAAPLFALGSLIVGVGQATGLMDWVIHFISPITKSVLLLPEAAGKVFVMGMIRRDFGAAGLYMMANTLSSLQILTALVTITLFVPCFASATVIFKERGTIESAAILLGSWVIAFATGAILARLLLLSPFT